MQMGIWNVNCFDHRRGQVKIQQMAFVLVALMVFFALVSLVYFSIRLSNLESGVSGLEDERARGDVRKLAASAEFAFTSSDCVNCIDLDKVLVLAGQEAYDGFWDFDYLKIEVVGKSGECSKISYPNCGEITLIESDDFGSAISSFVSLCRFDESFGGYTKCEMGRIVASGGALNA